MLEVAQPFARALMRAWSSDVIDSLSTAPRAHGSPTVHASGYNPDRILLLGDGLAAGWGVATHEIAIPGELVRALATLTGRGADVEVSAHTNLKGSAIQRIIEQRDLTGYDAVVVMVGASEVISLAPRKHWQRMLLSLCEMLLERTPSSAQIFVVGQLPFRPVAPFNNMFARSANSHAKTLNGISREICRLHSRLSYVELPPSNEPPTERLGTPERYRAWGRYIALQLVPYLDKGAHPNAS